MSFLGFAKNTVNLLKQKLTPICDNRLVFTSFGGHYSDNPKYISQKIHKLNPDKEIVWLVSDRYRDLLPPYVRTVDIDDKAAVARYRGSARAIIDNVYGEKSSQLESSGGSAALKFRFSTFLRSKRGQTVFTTWHGTPLKRMGRDQVGSHVRDFSCPNTTMILGNQYTLDIMQRLTFDKIGMELLGTPRNDPMFCSEEETRALKAKLGLPLDKKILLFAPTFRSDGDGLSDKNIARSGLDQLQMMQFEDLFRTLSDSFGGEWALVCRFHYHVEAMADWDSLQSAYPGQIINGNQHDDMAEYLACTDMLLTDASSSMFDFSLTKRPCLLLFPDLEYYATTERGFYTPITQLPFPVATTFEELLDNLRSFDAVAYAQGVEHLLHEYGYVDDADSSERVAKYILANV